MYNPGRVSYVLLSYSWASGGDGIGQNHLGDILSIKGEREWAGCWDEIDGNEQGKRS